MGLAGPVDVPPEGGQVTRARLDVLRRDTERTFQEFRETRADSERTWQQMLLGLDARVRDARVQADKGLAALNRQFNDAGRRTAESLDRQAAAIRSMGERLDGFSSELTGLKETTSAAVALAREGAPVEGPPDSQQGGMPTRADVHAWMQEFPATQGIVDAATERVSEEAATAVMRVTEQRDSLLAATSSVQQLVGAEVRAAFRGGLFAGGHGRSQQVSPSTRSAPPTFETSPTVEPPSLLETDAAGNLVPVVPGTLSDSTGGTTDAATVAAGNLSRGDQDVRVSQIRVPVSRNVQGSDVSVASTRSVDAPGVDDHGSGGPSDQGGASGFFRGHQIRARGVATSDGRHQGRLQENNRWHHEGHGSGGYVDLTGGSDGASGGRTEPRVDDGQEQRWTYYQQHGRRDGTPHDEGFYPRSSENPNWSVDGRRDGAAQDGYWTDGSASGDSRYVDRGSRGRDGRGPPRGDIRGGGFGRGGRGRGPPRGPSRGRGAGYGGHRDDDHSGSDESDRYEERGRSQSRSRSAAPSRVQMDHLSRHKSDRAKRWHAGVAGDPFRGADNLTDYDLSELGVPLEVSYQVMVDYQTAYEKWLAPGVTCSGASFSRAVRSDHYADLVSTDTYDFVEWYDKFRRDCSLYDIPLMPFEGINPKMAADGLFPPGLGLGLYDTIGRVIMPIVERCLPSADQSVQAQVRLVNGTSRNAYDLVWKLATVTVPIFDVTKNITPPVFDDCIFKFAQHYSLHNQLRRHRGIAMSDYDLLHAFLENMRSPRFHHMATAQLLNLESLKRSAAGAEVVLPPEWSLDAMAADMDRRCATVTDSMGLKRQSAPRRRTYVPRRVNRMEALDEFYPDDDEPEDGHLQGFQVMVNRTDAPASGGRGGTKYPDPAHAHRRRSRNPTFDGRCRACGRWGHQATTCDFLAMYAYIQKYWKSKSDKEVEAAEKRWTERNSKWLDGDSRTPTRVSKAYCFDCGIDPEVIAEEMDWDFFGGEAPEEDL